MKELKLSTIKKVLNEYPEDDIRVRKLLKACNRMISSSEVKYYLNRSGVKVIGEIGRFYISDELKDTTRKKQLRRLVYNNTIQWFSDDTEYKSAFENGRGRIVKYEYRDGKKFAIIEVKLEVRVITHRIGDVINGTNQLFIKIPILRERVNGTYVLNSTDIQIKNIKSRISLDEFDAWMNCDIDNNDSDSPFYSISASDDYSEDYIRLCKYLNERLNLNIDIEEYERRYSKNIQKLDTDKE